MLIVMLGADSFHDLLGNGYRWEPEGCFFYNGQLMIATGKNIWELSYQNIN